MDILAHFHAVLDYPDEDIDPFELAQFAGQLDEDAKALNRLLATCHRGRIVKDGPPVRRDPRQPERGQVEAYSTASRASIA